MSNLATWDKHANIDPKFTKPITGKAYRGTSPMPQHVIWCLTDMFGPAGQGFGWDVVAEGWQPLGDEVLHWCRIRFWHTDRANAFDAYGQTKALMKTKNGMMADEDAPKKSLTDAIVKAASQVGVAANIFLGRWDDQRYVADVANDFRAEAEAPRQRQAQAQPATDVRAETDRIIKKLHQQGTIADLTAAWTGEKEARRAVFDAAPDLHETEIKGAFAARKAALEAVPS